MQNKESNPVSTIDLLDLSGTLYEINKLRNISGNEIEVTEKEFRAMFKVPTYVAPATPAHLSQRTDGAAPYFAKADDPVIFLKKGKTFFVLLGWNHAADKGVIKGRLISSFALKAAKCLSQEEIDAGIAARMKTIPDAAPGKYSAAFNNAPRITKRY